MIEKENRMGENMVSGSFVGPPAKPSRLHLTDQCTSETCAECPARHSGQCEHWCHLFNAD